MIASEQTCMTISVVVPVFNAENSLRKLAWEVEAALRDYTFELVLVNDGSRDRSWKVIEELVLKHSWIRGFDLMRNYGQHNALLCGIRHARYDLIATIDDDLQNPPIEIIKLLNK